MFRAMPLEAFADGPGDRKRHTLWHIWAPGARLGAPIARVRPGSAMAHGLR
ncbi:hypothetical protein RA210_U20141 [Rubrivivax sp. A210]|nr:hypothetical protein RA210_U20141 [Rubrivivax sp. A210]